MDEAKPKTKSNTGLMIAAVFLAGIVFTQGEQFSSNSFYTLPLLVVAFGAGWLHYKSRFIKRSLLRWIALLLMSAIVLGFVAAIFNYF